MNTAPFVFPENFGELEPRFAVGAYCFDEDAAVGAALEICEAANIDWETIQERTTDTVRVVRERQRGNIFSPDALLNVLGISSPEGLALVGLTEALLRVPDSATADQLIRTKLASGDWLGRLPKRSLMLKAALGATELAKRIALYGAPQQTGMFPSLVRRYGLPCLRRTMKIAMRKLGNQFILGENTQQALVRAQRRLASHNERFSFDCLGEAALTQQQVEYFFNGYRQTIAAVGSSFRGASDLDLPEVSVKLSALHPRFELAQRGRVMDELVSRLKALAKLAAQNKIALTIDAEEAARLELTLDVLEAIASDKELSSWDGLGIALQTYQKRWKDALDQIVAIARSSRKCIRVRAVKGAYWDLEIKQAQQARLDDYPLFTTKEATDVAYAALAISMLELPEECIWPQFATHNAFTAHTILELAGPRRVVEFQRLEGMGAELYRELTADHPNCFVRIYAPIGPHSDVLAYFMRRLLEQGSNRGFVQMLREPTASAEALSSNPIRVLAERQTKRSPTIPNPRQLFDGLREHALGVNLFDPHTLLDLRQNLSKVAGQSFDASAIIGGESKGSASRLIKNPANNSQIVGSVKDATGSDALEALRLADRAQHSWEQLNVCRRCEILKTAAQLFEEHLYQFLYLLIREGGKTLPDAIADFQEAVDFLRYYSLRACQLMSADKPLPSFFGETNKLRHCSRGVFVCISPWNFPLAIFIGQVGAALASGNAVLAKPARQTPLVAHLAVKLLLQAGVPEDVIHFLPGSGSELGAALLSDRRVAGVAFTGSTEVAKQINQDLAAIDGPIAKLVAETGGMNALFADSTALSEQVVQAVIASSFRSTGQRCSSVRQLFLQNDIADDVLRLLHGAMDELVIGDPGLIQTDIGPVIDSKAKAELEAHIQRMHREATFVAALSPPENCAAGTFVGPHIFEIPQVSVVSREVFGPILHVLRYEAGELGSVIDSINSSGYGLTFGVHSRDESTIATLSEGIRVGNIYVNRDTVGAIVEMQPFGGRGLSGTGPKAGGPNYLQAFTVERTVTDNTAARGNVEAYVS